MLKDKMCYSKAEVSDILGITEQTLRTHIKNGRIDAVKLGRRVLIPRASLEKLLAGGKPAAGA